MKRAGLIVAGVVLCFGCAGDAPPMGTNPKSEADGGVVADGAVSKSGDGGEVSRSGYCAGQGPPIIVTDNGINAKQLCTGEMAEVAFRFAFCSCEDYAVSGGLATDSFDHMMGPYTPGGNAAAVGINGSITIAGEMDIGGALYVGSNEGIALSGEATARGGLHCNGDIVGAGDITVGGDANVNGDIMCSRFEVGGTLTQPSGSALIAAEERVFAQQFAPVTIAPPCDCTAETIFDIAKLVQTHATINDNAEIDLDPKALDSHSGATLDLPCGRFYLEEVFGSGELTFNISGRVALFVQSMTLGSKLKVVLAEGAELDLFVAGDLVAGAGMMLGSSDAPSRTRIYVGGSTITLNGDSTFNGNIYAPEAEMTAAGDLEVFGSVSVKSFTSAGSLSIHYDQAILNAGADCDETTQPTGRPVAGEFSLATLLLDRRRASPDA